jgi:CBS domain-containing protein
MMDPQPSVIPSTMSIGELAERLAAHDPVLMRHQALLLADERGELAGILTRGDLVRGLERDPSGSLEAVAAGSARPHVAYPDETLSEALARMLHHHCGRLPVVDRANPRRIVGYLGRAAMLEAGRRRLHEDQVREPGWLKMAR